MASILPNTDSLQLGRSYISRLCLIFGGSSAPPIQPLPLPAVSLSRPITSSTAFISSLQICCSGGHCTTIASLAAIAQQLLRRLSHSRALLHRSLIVRLILHSAPWMLQSRPLDRPWEGIFHFCGQRNLSSHLQNLVEFLWVGRGKQPPIKFLNFCRAEFPCFGTHSAAFTKISPQKFHFILFLQSFLFSIINILRMELEFNIFMADSLYH